MSEHRQQLIVEGKDGIVFSNLMKLNGFASPRGHEKDIKNFIVSAGFRRFSY